MESTFVVAQKAVVMFGGRALTIRRSETQLNPGIWEFAGGRLEFGEGLEQGLLREIMEETGLSVAIEKLLYAATFQSHPRRQVVLLNYLCRADDGAVTLSEEHDDYCWADKEQLCSLLHRRILDDLTAHPVFEAMGW